MANTSKKTIILFSGEMDKVLAAFVIANGAAAMGDEVTMFFTFWGLNTLRKPDKTKTAKKTTLQKMFAMMMPRGPKKLHMSNMNFAGMGPKLMNTRSTVCSKPKRPVTRSRMSKPFSAGSSA